jgi:hypothetical protein
MRGDGRPTWSLIYVRRRWRPDMAAIVAALVGGFCLGLLLARLIA